MTTEQIIEQILSKNLQITKEQIKEKLENEKRKTDGLISEATLLRMIASELGVDLQNNNTVKLTLSIVDLIPHLNNVSVTGRAIAVFQPKAFSGKRSGKFASVFIVDKSGVLRVILWNGKTTVIDSGEMKVGQILRFSHAYTKEGRDGVELHVGEKCQIEINPPNAKTSDFPTLTKFVTHVKELAPIGKRKVNIIGTVKQIFEASTFERQDLTTGKSCDSFSQMKQEKHLW